MREWPFNTFWMAGFECSCQRRQDGCRLDLATATGHERWAAADYARLRSVGIRTVREGLPWHRCVTPAGRLDLASVLPRVRAARDAGIQVIWDLCHYGWPEGVDIFRPAFVDRFAEWAKAVAEVVAGETGETGEIPCYVPVNEISFWSWAGGEVGYLNPFAVGRGFELKAQLVRAALAATAAVWSVDPRARILHVDPLIHIEPDPERPEDGPDALGHRLAQFQAWDMLRGELWPQLGGDPRCLDLMGVNYYPNNQWILNGPTIERGSPLQRPFRDMLRETWERYGRPLVVAETGAASGARGPWLAYIGDEVRAAQRAGVPILGVCLYPVLDYPGWDDERHCEVGLWGYADEAGERPLCRPLADELRRQQQLSAYESTNAGTAGLTLEERELATY
ncbi:MAG TPA: beta-glucosidase [Thermoanaerobaculia bacterium]|jgi:hypothetical protein|nr:beta-glucosidase [Thermoanaerobaculia bacterium]